MGYRCLRLWPGVSHRRWWNQWFRSPFPPNKDIILEYLSIYIYVYIYIHIYYNIQYINTDYKTSLFDILFDGSIVAYPLKQYVFSWKLKEPCDLFSSQAVTYQKAYPTEPFRHMMCAPGSLGFVKSMQRCGTKVEKDGEYTFMEFWYM
jgi:hypothetical protein